MPSKGALVTGVTVSLISLAIWEVFGRDAVQKIRG